MAIFAGGCVAVYNFFALRFALPTLLVAVAIINAALLITLELLRRGAWHASPFVLYVWKDVYIVIMLEIMWSWANLVFRSTTARWAFGLFCAAGSLGSISGNLSVGVLADRFGTSSNLLFALPLFGIIAWVTTWPAAQIVRHRFAMARQNPTDFELRPTTRRYLLLILALIVIVQLVITWVDFVYNQTLEIAYPDVDARTVIAGRVYAAIDGVALVLQLSTGALVRALTLPVVLVGIPTLVGASVGALLAWPGFISAAASKTVSKAMDYSLFKASKEMLYIPLNYGEKTRAKAIIDMFGYRSAKGGASVLLLLLVSAVTVPTFVALTFFGIVCWWILAYRLSQRPPISNQ